MINYAIFQLLDGMLVGATPAHHLMASHWAKFPKQYLAVRQTAKGKPQVRWLCSGLDASAQENRNALDNLRALRKRYGYDEMRSFSMANLF